MLRRLSIHNKLTLALSGVALAAFVVAGVALVFFENLTLRQRARQTLEPYAQLVSVGAEAAVRFEDADRAREILHTLRTNPQILEAEIILSDGSTLASYSSQPSSSPKFDAAKPDGVYLSADSAELVQRLPDGAHLHLLMSLDEIKRQTMNVVLALAAGLLGLLIAINLSLRATLKRSIVRPISTLAATVEQVRSGADYHQRVPSIGTDEVARLGRSFNAMMDAIEERDGELRKLTLFQQALLDHAAYSIISAAPDGTVSSFNPAAERLLGYTAAEVVGKLTPAVWHDPDEVARHARRLSEELGETIPPGFEVFAARPQRNLPEENEWTFVCKDGTRVPVLLSVTALRDGNGQITGFLGMVHDLTERKKNEAALREKTEELDRYFTNTLDLLCIADTEGHFRRMNTAWERTLGYSVAELEGRSFLDFVHPDDREATLQAVSLLGGQHEVVNFANRYRAKDGGYRWLEWRSIPSGSRIYAVARDITERKRTEEALLFIAQRGWRTGAENFLDALTRFLCEKLDMDYAFVDKVDEKREVAETVALCAKGVVVPNLRYALKGTPCENVMGRNLCIYRHGIQGLFPEDALLPQMGAESYIGIPLWDSAGQSIGLIAVMGNKPLADDAPVTQLLQLVATRAAAELERNRAEEALVKLNAELDQRVRDRTAQLEASNKELESFSYSVSHDLRTPLRSIDGFSRILLDDYADRLDADGKDSLNRIRAASQRMGHLIDDLLKLAQLSRAEIRRGPVDLSKLAVSVAEGLRQANPKQSLEFVIEPGLVAHGDAGLLQIALENLLGNACKFSSMRAVARIEFGRTTYEGRPAYFVKDNGAGFDPGTASKIFGAFQRFHTPEEFPGTGIGLATVQRIIHRHGGRIVAESRPDQGAKFTFTLPDPNPTP
ncbi:MAG TPA: PAS domain S-box protein [Lacunisphaera sp.]